jgi:hypothetical protein
MIDDARSQAYEAAKTVALGLYQLGAALTLPDTAATAVRKDAAVIARVLMPRIEVAGTLAQIAVTAIERMITAGKDADPREMAPACYQMAAFCTGGLPPTRSPAKLRAAGLARALLGCIEAGFLGAAFLAEAQSDFPDRQAAIAARTRIAAALDDAGDRIARAAGLEIHAILMRVARHANDKLIADLTDLRPVVRVDSMRSWPSTALAWALYEDPARAPELVARNNCGTPLFMPSVIEALSPGAA